MDTIFTLGEPGDITISKLNLDELYERKKQCSLNTLKIYNRILQRIHNRIKHTSRTNIQYQHCWYIMPEIMIGIPKYDHVECTAYIIDKLMTDGLQVKYTTPNLLFISWSAWTPGYVREEIRKKTGVSIDGQGNTKVTSIGPGDLFAAHKSTALGTIHKASAPIKNKDYKDITTYKPTGNLIYNPELLQRVEDKSKM